MIINELNFHDRQVESIQFNFTKAEIIISVLQYKPETHEAISRKLCFSNIRNVNIDFMDMENPNDVEISYAIIDKISKDKKAITFQIFFNKVPMHLKFEFSDITCDWGVVPPVIS